MSKKMFTMTLLVVSIIFQSHAQDTTQTLLKLIKPQTIGLYIAPEVGYGQVRGSMTNLGGASIMLILNKKWAFGATSQMIANRNFSPTAISPNTVRGGWAGVKMEYTPKPDKLIHVSFPLMVGGGRVSADTLGYRWGRRGDWYEGRSNNSNTFIVVQPGINLEMNLLRYAKLYVGATYRLSFLQNNQTALLPANTLQGYAIHAGLRMGLFDLKLKRKQAENSEPQN